jgi:hypothetical protein
MKKVSQVAKDDRPEEKLSFAATNLVKPELQSRARQQSEPPISRNMFPPTPPPEADGRKPNSASSNSDAPMSRAQSVRGGGPKPQPLNLGRAAFDQQTTPDQTPRETPRRQGTQRSASERPAPSRSESQRTRQQRDFKPRRRATDEDIIDDYYDEDEDYNPRGSRGANTRSKQSRRPAYIEEEDEEDEYDGSDIDDADFEMMPNRTKSRRRSPARSNTTRNRVVQSTKIRVKVHAGDTRYVFIKEETTMRDFSQSIKEKFGVRSNFKVEFKDDGDMITMADQDDLDMAIQTAKGLARRENSEMAKLEVSLVHSRSNSSPPS